MRFAAWFGLLAVSAPLTGCTPQPSEPADPFAGIPNVQFLHYDVGGTSAREIRRAINAARQAGLGTNAPYDASTSWRFKWQWPVDRKTGTCDLANTAVTFSAKVRLPRLADPERLGSAVRARWDRYYAALLAHEAGHARYPYAHRGELLAAIKGSDCAHASEAAKAVLARFTDRDHAYDAETRHGATQGATFP